MQSIVDLIDTTLQELTHSSASPNSPNKDSK